MGERIRTGSGGDSDQAAAARQARAASDLSRTPGDAGVEAPEKPRGGPTLGPFRSLPHPVPLLIAVLAAYDVIYGGLWLSGLVHGGMFDRLTGAAVVPAGAGVVVVGFGLRRSPTADAHSRRGWPLISAGVLSYALGFVVLFAADELALQPLSVVGLAFELSTYVLVGAGFANLAMPSANRTDTALAWIDVAIVGWSTAMLVWHFVLYPIAVDMHRTVPETLYAAISPVGDLALVFAAGAVLLRGTTSTSQKTMLLGSLSMLFMFGGDVVYGIEDLRGTYQIGGVSGLFYGFAWLGLISAAGIQLRYSPAAVPWDLTRYRRAFQWLPYVAVFLAFAGPPLYHWNDVALLEQHIPATGFLMALVVTRLLLTARQNASLAVAERARLAAAVEQAAEAILTTDRHWRVTYANAAVRRIVGDEPNVIEGGDTSLIREAADQNRLAAMRAEVEAGGTWNGRIALRRADGLIVELDMSVAPIREAGEAAGAVIVARDITRERALESQLAQTQRLEAVGRLAGGIAHDFNNILTAISGFSELAASSLPPDHPAASDLREVLKASDRAAGLTHDLLAFGRRQVMQPKLLDLNDVIEGMRSMLERTLGEDIALRFRAQSGLGLTIADRSQMEQVIVNLAMNARDAMPDGGMLTITTADADFDETYQRTHLGTSAGQYVSVTVADTGVGMSPEVLEHAFEPFFTTKPRTRATGLGLSTVSGIVEQSGGFIVVDSSPGSGSVFSVFLPRVADTETAQETGAENTTLAGGTETILVAEDEAPVRRVMERVLRTAGYRVNVAANGHEALAIAPTLPRIDLLLTDVVMPGLSGVDLARTLSRERPDLRVLFASGYSGDALLRVGARESVPYLAKPFTTETLLARVRRTLDEPNARYFD